MTNPPRRRLRARAGTALVLAAAACAPQGRPTGAVSPDRDVPSALASTFRFQITNQNWSEVEIWVRPASGGRVRLGNVSTGQTQGFVVQPARLGFPQSIRLVADPLGDRQDIVSESFVMNPGEIAFWTIEQSGRLSRVRIGG